MRKFKIGDIVKYRGFLCGNYAVGYVREFCPDNLKFKMDILYSNINYIDSTVALPISKTSSPTLICPEYFKEL